MWSTLIMLTCLEKTQIQGDSKVMLAKWNIISTCQYNTYEGESNENLKYFLNAIYCAEVVQSCITSQHNHPHAQCKSCSAYKVHKLL